MKKLLMLSTVIACAPVAFDSGGVPTKTIKTDNGPVTINESDFDPETHEEYDPEAEGDAGDDGMTDEQREAAATAAKEQARRERIETWADPGVIMEGDKFFAVEKKADGSTEKVKGLRGINAQGYKSQKAAWDAVFLVRSEVTRNPADAPTT